MESSEKSEMKRMRHGVSILFGVVLITGAMLSIGRRVRAAAPTFTTIDFPGACGTIATGINYSGTIVGDSAPNCKLPEVVHGYVLSQGAFTQFDFPGATFTRPLGINDAADIVGFYRDSKQGKDHGFVLSGGTFTKIDFPGADQTHALHIDSAGNIFGSYCIGGNACYNPGESVHGFALSEGKFTTIDFPGAILTEVWGQDRAGEIAGRYQDASGLFHAFLLSGDNFTSFDFPGADETAPSFYGADGGFNIGGDIASSYCGAEPCANPSPSVHSFFMQNGQFTSFDPPGSLGSFGLGINSINEIVGAYVGQDGRFHGYLRTP